MTDAAVHRVVIVGAGFAGLFAAKVLRHAPVEVTVVDGRNHHCSGRCSTSWPRASSPRQGGAVDPDVLRRHPNATVVLAMVASRPRVRTLAAHRPDETVPPGTTG